jgi:hypothetical protein
MPDASVEAAQLIERDVAVCDTSFGTPGVVGAVVSLEWPG